MRVTYLTTAITLISLSTLVLPVHASEANDGATEHNWMPKQPVNRYWQAPDWSNFNFSSNQPGSNFPVMQTGNNSNSQPPQQLAQQAPVQQAPAYRPPPPVNRYQAPAPRYQAPPNQYRGGNPGRYQQGPANANRGPYNRGPTNSAPYNRGPAATNNNRSNPPPPRGPYNSGYRPDNGASAYNIPGYNRYRNNNGRNNNKFWGRSGPSRWMNPNKNNMEQGWDDMINSPSRMGEMPGGWTAPEVSMPNPIDMGDQMQDNVKDLPEQIRNMDVGN